MISDAININGQRYVLREDYDVLAAKVAELEKDAARWRWARQDETLWSGTYDYGIALPDGADEVADACLASADGAKP